MRSGCRAITGGLRSIMEPPPYNDGSLSRGVLLNCTTNSSPAIPTMVESLEQLKKLKQRHRTRYYRNTDGNAPNLPSGTNKLSMIKDYFYDPGVEESIYQTSSSRSSSCEESPDPSNVQKVLRCESLQTSKLSLHPTSRVKTDPKRLVASEPRLEQGKIPHFTSCRVNAIPVEEDVLDSENEQLHLLKRNVETPNTRNKSKVQIYTDGSVVQEPPLTFLLKRFLEGESESNQLALLECRAARALERDFGRNSANHVDRETDLVSNEMDIRDAFSQEETENFILFSKESTSDWDTFISEKSPSPIRSEVAGSISRATGNRLELQSMSSEISKHSNMGQQSEQKKEKFVNSMNDKTDLNGTCIKGSAKSKTPSGSGQQASSKPLKTPEQSSEQSQRPLFVGSTPVELDEFIICDLTDGTESPDWTKNKKCPQPSIRYLSKSKKEAKLIPCEGQRSSSESPASKPRNKMSAHKTEEMCIKSTTKKEGKNIQSQSVYPHSSTDVPALLKDGKKKPGPSKVDKLSLSRHSATNVIHLDKGLSARPKCKQRLPSKWCAANAEVSKKNVKKKPGPSKVDKLSLSKVALPARPSLSKKIKKARISEVDKLALPTYFATSAINLDEGLSSRPRRMSIPPSKLRAENISLTGCPSQPKRKKKPETNSEDSLKKQKTGKKTSQKKSKKLLEQKETSQINVESEKMELSRLKRLKYSEENERSPKHTPLSSHSDEFSGSSSEEIPETGNANNCEDDVFSTESGSGNSQTDELTPPSQQTNPLISPRNPRNRSRKPANSTPHDVSKKVMSFPSGPALRKTMQRTKRNQNLNLADRVGRLEDVTVPPGRTWTCLDNPLFSAGKLILMPSEEIAEDLANENMLYYYIIRGNVELKRLDSCHQLKGGDFFVVSPCNGDVVVNPGPDTAELVFTKLKPLG